MADLEDVPAPRPAAGRPRGDGLDRAEVMRLALRIADSEGLAGLTMRRLAQDLGVSLGTIYAAVGSKTDILSGLVDEVLSDLSEDVSSSEQDDTEAIVRLWTHAHTLLVAHPAVAELAATQPLTGTPVYSVLETTLRHLEHAGLGRPAAVHAYTVLRSYLIGFTVLRVTRAEQHADDERSRIEEMRQLPSDAFPTVRQAAPLLQTQMTDDHFTQGLRQILDAVAAN